MVFKKLVNRAQSKTDSATGGSSGIAEAGIQNSRKRRICGAIPDIEPPLLLTDHRFTRYHARQFHYLAQQKSSPYKTNTVHMPEIKIYSRRFCSYCTAAKSLLESQGYEFTELNLDEDPDLAESVMLAAGMRTVPIITVGDQPVGGFRELYSAINGGEFADLVASEQD